MTNEDERELESELARLQQEHRDLDAAIDALHQSPAPDLLRLQRLKKRKLQLRDRIAFIEDQITPDIIACRPNSPVADQLPQHACHLPSDCRAWAEIGRPRADPFPRHGGGRRLRRS